MRAATKRRLRFFIGVLALIAAGGALLGSVLGRASLVNALVSTVDALLILGIIAAIEIFLPRTRVGSNPRTSPEVTVARTSCDG